MDKVSLSFEEGMPIALVSGGEMDKAVLHLLDRNNEKKKGKYKQELPYTHGISKLPPRKQAEAMRILNECYMQGIPPPPHLQSLYEGMTEEQEKHIQLPPGSTFELLPMPEGKRMVAYIAGASGSGKSYIAKGLAEKYKKQFPDHSIYLVSKLGDDSTLDSMKIGKPIRLNIQKLVEEPPKDLEPLRDCLILFDDYDSFDGKEAKVIQQLIDDIATMGRHTNTSMLCMTHYLTNYKKTRLMLTEATHFVLYPQSTGNHALSYLLKQHLGMDNKEVQQLRKSGSRWVCVYKNFPRWVVTEREAYLL